MPPVLSLQPNKVYIGGLPEHTRKEDLESCFGKIGTILNVELKYVCQAHSELLTDP
jgi:RNA recognition motif-containing protein